jgi:putative peptidoglycan lipid II flippase
VSETGQGSADGNGRAVVGAAGLLAGSVLIARALGYLRDALFASEVGIGSGADAYFAAFMIPDILGYLLAAGAAATAVTPPYLKRLQEQGPEAAARFASVVVGTVGIVSIAFTVLLWFAAEPLVRIQFPDFDGPTIDSTVHLMRIVLPAQIFFLTGGILRGVLMAHGRFGPQAWAAVIYSAAPIVGGLALGGAEGFAWGTLAGAALGQWAIPVLALRQLPGAVGRMRIGLFDGDFREYVWLALPLMLGLGLTTVDEWYEKWVGGQIDVGAIAAITYARKLMMAPVGVVGQAVGAALLPSLTMLYQNGDEAGFRDLFGRTLRTTLGLGILAAGALALLATPLVELLYERRAFTAENTAVVSGLLVVLSIGVPGWVVQQIAVRGFYARGEMWRAMILSTSVALAVIPLYLIGGAREGIRGLAMASATAISLNALITVVWLRRRTGAPRLRPLAETFVRTALIMLIGSFVASFLLSHLSFAANRSWLALPVGGGIYAVVAVASARALGDAPLRAGIDAILARLTRRPPRRSEPR